MLWGRVDSNHRTHPRTDLQSVAIAAMRLPQGFLRCKITQFYAMRNNFYQKIFSFRKELCINILQSIFCVMRHENSLPPGRRA